MTRRFFLGLGPHGFHRVAYGEQGPADAARTVVCVHGLTRNGRDFDALAGALAGRGWRVVCPDMPGRGDSDWLPQAADYAYPTYLADMAALLARLDVEAVDWVGTSMGGIIGMMLAAQPGSPIRRLVVNDVGGFIPKAAIERLQGYVGLASRFGDIAETEAWLRRVHAGFGPLTDDQWRTLAEHSVRPAEGGGWRLHYDPAIGEALRATPADDIALWPVWDAVRCPVLVLRGGESDLLPAETAQEMRSRGPGCDLVEFPGVGHAPALLDEEQIRVVAEWLGRD